jgi:hypothetical protein
VNRIHVNLRFKREASPRDVGTQKKKQEGEMGVFCDLGSREQESRESQIQERSKPTRCGYTEKKTGRGDGVFFFAIWVHVNRSHVNLRFKRKASPRDVGTQKKKQEREMRREREKEEENSRKEGKNLKTPMVAPAGNLLPLFFALRQISALIPC